MESQHFTCFSSQLSQIFTALEIGCILISIAMINIYLFTYRDYMKLILFDKLSLRIGSKQNEIKVADYDVYLLYADQDYYWTQHFLLTGLERKGFRIFDFNRDAISGTSRVETIECALSESHRVVVVLTPLLCEDADALTVFYRAEAHQDTRLNQRYIIILTMDKKQRWSIPEDVLQIFEKYLITSISIHVNSSRFWSQLLYILPDPPRPPDVYEVPYVSCIHTDG